MPGKTLQLLYSDEPTGDATIISRVTETHGRERKQSVTGEKPSSCPWGPPREPKHLVKCARFCFPAPFLTLTRGPRPALARTSARVLAGSVLIG